MSLRLMCGLVVVVLWACGRTETIDFTEEPTGGGMGGGVGGGMGGGVGGGLGGGVGGGMGGGVGGGMGGGVGGGMGGGGGGGMGGGVGGGMGGGVGGGMGGGVGGGMGGGVGGGLGGGVGGGGGVACVVIPDAIAWWDADSISGNTVNDIVGPHDAASVGMSVPLVTGVVGNALRFSSTASVLSAPHSASLNLRTSLSIETWINPRASTRWWRRIIGKQVDDTENDSAWLFGLGSNGGVYFGLFRNNVQFLVDGSRVVSPGAWHHVAGTWDGTSMRVYVDGNLDPTMTVTTGALQLSSQAVRIGRGNTSLYALDGDVDELTLYDRALTATEVRAIFDAGAAGKCKTP